MATIMDADWAPIYLHNTVAGLPQLFVRYTITSSSYSVFLTDLNCVWLEQLNRQEIVQRALNEKTTIDPTEDACQLSILLERIKAALEGGDDTQLWLIRERTSNGLILQTTSKLPPPLGILHWPIHFSPSVDQTVRDTLVLPLLCSAYSQKQSVRQLIGHINEKDHIILRLLDKLESSGADLSSVFPGISSLKGVGKATSREQAARHVKGLSPFNEQHWRQGTSHSHLGTVSLTEVTRSIFTSGAHLDISNWKAAAGKDEWWNALNTSIYASIRDHPATSCGTENATASTEEEDEFQVK